MDRQKREKRKREKSARKEALRKKHIRYGLMDTKDGLWLGDGDGAPPKTYDDEFIAQTAARVLGHQLGWDLKRIEARPLPPGPFRQRDTVTKKPDAKTALEIIQALEEGRLL